MSSRITFRLIISGALVSVLTTCGCGQSGSGEQRTADSETDFLDGLLGDIDLADAPLPEESSPPADESDDIEPVARAASQERLELKLTPGDQFPLVKTVEQTLVQKSEQYPGSAQSKLQLHMTIRVRDVQQDAALLNVLYSRVVYSHDVDGAQTQYDSDVHTAQAPPEMLPYAGLVGNGFSFWLGKDNKIRQLVDFDNFLQRCVQHVPEDRRRSLLAEISARFRNDGVAGFVDDTIGLLPYNRAGSPDTATEVSVGDVWTRQRQTTGTAPMQMTSTCRLLSMTPQTAEIGITEQITPVSSPQPGVPAPAVQITAGRSMGSCTVDRTTGLPIELNRSRYLSLLVTTDTGVSIPQEKRIETTIRTLPRASASRVVQAQHAQTVTERPLFSTSAAPSPTGGIQPASAVLQHPHSRPGLSNAGMPSTPSPGLSSTARAVYPD